MLHDNPGLAMEIYSVNGCISSSISPLNRGLAYGDGVFETLRIINGQIPLWNYHKQRLQEGCRRLKISLSLPDLDRWLGELLEAGDEEVHVSAIVKIIVTRGAGGRGYRPDFSLAPDMILSIQPFSAVFPVPVELCICNYRLSSNPFLAGMKHLNRLDNVMLQAECAQRGFDDGLALDAEDNIVEATSSNLFFEADGALFTPAIDSCGVDGVMRRFILHELCTQLEIKVSVEQIAHLRLQYFESAFCSNSVRGIVPVARIADQQFSRGVLTSKLQLKLAQLGY